MEKFPSFSRTLVFLLAVNLVGVFSAAASDEAVKNEVDALISKLETSGCEFNRNGSWHSASEAGQHLRQKLAYAEGRSNLKNAEQFIEVAGSSSSFTGKPYLVRCAGAPTVESQNWLRAQLASMRSSSGTRSASQN